jgi:AbrB family looped-hinge helix DNA binding protein
MKKYPKIVQCDSRGQIVIPKDIRADLKIDEGTGFFVYTVADEGILLKRIKPEELGDHKAIVEEIKENADKLGIDKRKIDSAVKQYKRTREGRLEVV